MRRAVPVAAVAAIVAVAGVALAGGDGGESACGDVGDREGTMAPNGRRAAFVRCTSEGSAWLYVAEGGRERRVVPTSYGCCYRPSTSVVFREPAWSPDGRALAVVIEDAGGTDVWTIGADGRTAHRVTSGPAREGSPRWSADGRLVSFARETGGRASVKAFAAN